MAACQPGYWLTQIARVACRPVWAVKTINKREAGAQNSNLGLSSAGNDFLEDSPYEPVNSRLSDISLLAPIMGESKIWIFSFHPLWFASDKFWFTFRPCMHPAEGSVRSVCLLLSPALLSSCSVHSRACMLAWGALVPCPTRPVASDGGGGLCCRSLLSFGSSGPLVEMSEWAREWVGEWVSEGVESGEWRVESGEWRALFRSHLRVGVMLTQTSRWWCYSLFHNHLVALWLS